MSAGGNSTLREYFSIYGFNHLTPIEKKYRSKAAHYYKKRLDVISDGKTFDAGILKPDEGVKPADETFEMETSESKKIDKNTKKEHITHTGIRGLFDSAMSATKSTGGFAIGLVQPAINTIEEAAWGVVSTVENTIYSIVDKTVHTGLSALSYAKDTTFSLVKIGGKSSKEVTENMMNKGSSVLGVAKDMAKEIAYVPEKVPIVSQITNMASNLPSSVSQMMKLPQIDQETVGIKVLSKGKAEVNPHSFTDKGEFKGDVASLKISYDKAGSDPSVQKIKKKMQC